MRRADIRLLFLVALMAALLAVVYSCSNPKDPVDTTDPAVAITNPANNATIPNTVDVRADASDNEKVTRVEFYIDAQLYYTDNMAPWSCLWTLEVDESGQHTVFAKAFDETGNWDASDLVTVTCENTPPAAVADLDATDADINGDLTFTWTAPGDDGTTGTAAVYDLRYYWVPITADNWVSAVRVEGEPIPQAAGSSETCDVSALSLSRHYYFAIRTQDAIGNWSALSNVVEVTTPDLLSNPLSFSIGDLASSVAAADFDGDLDIDLAVARMADTNNVSVLFNAGNGTFADPVVYYARRQISSITAADVDNDGDMDLAAANYARTLIIPVADTVSRVSVLENVGAGVFELVNLDTYDTSFRWCSQPAYDPNTSTWVCNLYSTIPRDTISDFGKITGLDSMVVDTTVNPYYAHRRGTAICAADFNNDGWTDLAVSNQISTNLSVLRNNGAGTFLTPVNHPCGKNNPNGICASDFNGDGWIDLVNTNGGNDQVTVFMNNMDGTLGQVPTRTPNYTIDVGDFPTSICTGDVNGDGRFDLMIANSLESNVSILLWSSATNRFLTETVRPAGRGSRSVAAANMCGDAGLELIVANNYDDNISMMMNEGQFLYYSYNTVEFMAGDGPVDVECADFDGDGDNDVAVLNQNDGTVTILFNQTVQ